MNVDDKIASLLPEQRDRIEARAIELQREAVVAEALSWVGTPFHYGNAVKGAGADCCSLLLEVYRSCGLIADASDIPTYSHDWFQHSNTERYKFAVLRHARKLVSSVAEEKVIGQPGDIVLCKALGSRLFNHGAIVVKWPIVVQAKIGGVYSCSVESDPMWNGAIEFFSPWKDAA